MEDGVAGGGVQLQVKPVVCWIDVHLRVFIHILRADEHLKNIPEFPKFLSVARGADHQLVIDKFRQNAKHPARPCQPDDSRISHLHGIPCRGKGNGLC